MNSNHFPDLSRCKKLTEIGFPETEMGWYTHGRSEITLIITSSEIRELCIEVDNYDMNNNLPDSIDYYLGDYKYRCPSVMEMLDVIPKWLDMGDFGVCELVIDVADHGYIARIQERAGNMNYKSFPEKSLPNALADLIFWLHENNYIKF